MKRGTINEQFLKVPQKNSPPVLRGPYYVLSKSSGGKTISKRIKKEDLETVKKDIEKYNTFVQLTEEFVVVTEKITEIVRSSDEKKDEMLKKNNTFNCEYTSELTKFSAFVHKSIRAGEPIDIAEIEIGVCPCSARI